MLEAGAGQILAEELKKFQSGLQLSDSQFNQPQTFIADISAVLQHLTQATEGLNNAASLLENEGLTVFAEWLTGNLEFLVDDLPRLQQPQHHHLLSQWLEALMDCLLATEDSYPQAFAELEQQMRRQGWPDPGSDELIQFIALELEPALGSEDQQTVPAEGAESILLQTTDDNAIQMSWDHSLDQRLLDAFFAETPDLVEQLSEELQKFSQGTGDINNAKRLAHTIKGSAALINLSSVQSLTHALEDALEFLQDKVISPAQAEILSETADWLAAAFEALPTQAYVNADCVKLEEEIRQWQTETKAPQSFLIEPIDPVTQQIEKPTVTEDRQTTLRIPLTAVNNLMDLMGQQTIGIGQLEGGLQKSLATAENINQLDQLLLERLDELETQVTHKQLADEDQGSELFDPLEMDRYQALHSVTNAFVETLTDIRHLNQNLNHQLNDLRSLLQSQVRLRKDFNDAVLNTRMESASLLDQRFHRAVREAVRQTDKKAELTISGSDIRLDTDILNTLVNPIVHMLRNAVDHGIESPDLRQQQGKNEAGQIKIRYHRSGNQICIDIEDDGHGLDPERILRTAIRRGLISANQQLDQQDCLQLILQPGFSTRLQANQLSGRGIGMDLVKQAIDDLHGSIHIDNQPGQGCCFRLSLPLTLVIAPVLLVEAGNQVHAIPSASIEQLLYAETDSIQQQDNDYYFSYLDQTWPIQPLSRLIGYDEEQLLTRYQGLSVLLVQTDKGTEALIVSKVLENREVVVKSLGKWLPNIAGISGACILADGNVAPVLDIPRLMRDKQVMELKQIKPDNQPLPFPASRYRILAVDDSLSAREALVLAIQQGNYDVISAIDGLDAIQILDEQNVDLVITDLEMPRMNGFELIDHLRSHQQTKQLPVIVISSRSTQKHRELAQLAGADGYITKPFDKDKLFQQIQYLLN